MRLDRLRIDSWKQRIDLAANLQKLDAALAEYASQHAAPGAVTGVNGKFEAGFGNEVEIGKFCDGLDVGLLEIGLGDFGRAGSLGCSAGAQLVFDLGNNRGCGGASVLGFEFNAVPVPGIVALGHPHAASRPEVFSNIGGARRVSG